MEKIKVSIDEIIKLSNYSHRDFGTFASFLKGLADSDGFIEVDSNNELLETHTVKEPCEHKKSTVSKSTRRGTRKICNNCGQDWKKEWDVTPPSNSEKEECCNRCDDRGEPGYTECRLCPCHKENKCCEEVEICCSHNGNFTGETSEIDNYTGRKCVCTCHKEEVKEECPCKKFKEKYPLGVFGGGGNDPLVIMSINCKVCDVEPPKEPSIELCEKCHMAYKGEHARFCIANDYKTGEEPATPEKKCCEDWVTGAIIDEMTRVNPARHLLKGHQGEKRNDIY